MTTFREFLATSIDDPDPRRAKFARVNATLAGLLTTAAGMAVAHALDGPVLITIILGGVAAFTTAVVMLRISYALYQRGESKE